MDLNDPKDLQTRCAEDATINAILKTANFIWPQPNDHELHCIVGRGTGQFPYAAALIKKDRQLPPYINGIIRLTELHQAGTRLGALEALLRELERKLWWLVHSSRQEEGVEDDLIRRGVTITQS
jgi:hypothetical protein